jgi:hypothetical protein
MANFLALFSALDLVSLWLARTVLRSTLGLLEEILDLPVQRFHLSCQNVVTGFLTEEHKQLSDGGIDEPTHLGLAGAWAVSLLFGVHPYHGVPGSGGQQNHVGRLNRIAACAGSERCCFLPG